MNVNRNDYHGRPYGSVRASSVGYPVTYSKREVGDIRRQVNDHIRRKLEEKKARN